ncbi:hypothetical protein [Marinifilum sp.]|uniref:hypothetical protein n=1 Tax=Marinifilum sp. TaxID=2033137 RepID=UPI003BAD0976
MKKLLFVIAICGFVLSSCGNKTKTANSEDKACCCKEKTETTADLKKGCANGCTHGAKTECSAEASAEHKGECCKDKNTGKCECKEGTCNSKCDKESCTCNHKSEAKADIKKETNKES